MRLLIATAVIALASGRIAPALSRISRNAWDIGLYFILLGLGLLYSDDSQSGLKVLETSFSLFAVAVVFAQLGPLDGARVRTVFYAFTAGLFLACFLSLGNSILRYSQTGSLHSFFFEEFTSTLSFQPTYFAYYLIFATAFSLYSVFYGVQKTTGFLLAAAVLFFIVLMLSGGRTAFISLLLVFAFFILKYLLEPTSSYKRVVFIVVTTMLLILFAVNSLDYWTEYTSIKGDYWERTGLWKAAINANPEPLLGVGTGDHKQALNTYYRSHGLGEFAEDSYNSHNQFLQIYLSNGLLGLFSLFIMLGRPLYRAASNQDALSVLIFFPFIVYGMTEVFLGRYQGVVLFALVHQLIISQHDNSRPALTDR